MIIGSPMRDLRSRYVETSLDQPASAALAHTTPGHPLAPTAADNTDVRDQIFPAHAAQKTRQRAQADRSHPAHTAPTSPDDAGRSSAGSGPIGRVHPHWP